MITGKCNFKWVAPFIHLDKMHKQHVRYIEQICFEKKGHKGDHRSITNVIKSQIDDGFLEDILG